MKVVFADTSFWVARVNPDDQWAASATRAIRELRDFHMVTSDFVIVEFLNAQSGRGSWSRKSGIDAARMMMTDPTITVTEATRALLLDALELYEHRGDKAYSLTDCATILEMRRRRIDSVLTSDSDFEQEGFTILMKRR